MVTEKSTASPDTYRVDIVHDDRGDTLHVVMRCEPVAKFTDEAHAVFLVDLLTKGMPA